jgi:hypothetical protein
MIQTRVTSPTNSWQRVISNPILHSSPVIFLMDGILSSIMLATCFHVEVDSQKRTEDSESNTLLIGSDFHQEKHKKVPTMRSIVTALTLGQNHSRLVTVRFATARTNLGQEKQVSRQKNGGSIDDLNFSGFARKS